MDIQIVGVACLYACLEFVKWYTKKKLEDKILEELDELKDIAVAIRPDDLRMVQEKQIELLYEISMTQKELTYILRELKDQLKK